MNEIAGFECFTLHSKAYAAALALLDKYNHHDRAYLFGVTDWETGANLSNLLRHWAHHRNCHRAFLFDPICSLPSQAIKQPEERKQHRALVPSARCLMPLLSRRHRQPAIIHKRAHRRRRGA